MDPRNRQERSDRPVKKGGGCGVVAIVIAVLAVPAVAVIAFIVLFWVRKAEVAEKEWAHAEAYSQTERGLPEHEDESGTVILTEESIGGMSAIDFGNELSREQFVAVMVDDHATDLMREQFEEKANGLRVKWLLRVDDVAAPDSNGAIKASLSMPYRITRGSGWSGSSVFVRAEFGPDAVDDLLKVRRGQWMTLEGELAIEGKGRNARILGARVVE